MSTSAALLPQEVLVQILQHVPLNNRFSSCALVSTAWAAAACAATDTVSLKALSDPERLTAWLRMHGPQVSSICIRNGREKALQLQDLPCSRLCDLQLGHFELDLCAGMTGPAQARAQGSAEQLGQGVAQQMAQGASQWPAQCTAQGSHTRAQESAHTTQPGAAQMPGWGSAQGAAHGLLHARGLLQAATGLTSLVLASCSIGISQQQFAPLAKLTTLEHLELDNVTKEFLTDDSETDEAPAAVLRAGVLRPLTRLTHLTLDWMRAGKAVQQDLSCLVNLRELSICLVGSSWRLVSQLLLPVGLTHLWLENYSHRIFDAHTLPGFDNLTALQELSVKDCQGFDAALLGGKTKMQGLVLDDTELEGDDSAAVFLGSLSDMQDLQVLKLSCALCDSGFGSARQPMEQYVPFAALTASTNLTYWEAALEDIPPWAWAYIWNPERPPYLNLTTLKVHLGTDPEEDGYPPYAIPRDCVRRLALCCPAVESFTLSWPQSLKLDLAPLKQLTGLTKLCLESIHSGKEPLVYSDSDSDFDDLPLWQHLVWRSAQKVGLTVPQALDTVTALTGLRSLKLSGRGSLVDDAIVSSQQLLRMTVLQRLTRLEVPYHTFSKLPVSIWAGAYSWDKNLMFTNKASKRSPPDVWRQIQQHCREQQRVAAARQRLRQQQQQRKQQQQQQQRKDGKGKRRAGE